MRRLFKSLTLILFVLSFLYSIFIFIYVVREPDFSMPIEIKGGEIPIRDDDYGEGHFGAKRRNGRMHNGIDIQTPLGTPVYASKSGLARCINLKEGYGKLIVIYHPDGYQTRYGHLNQFNIRSFQWVSQKDIIGFVGKTGNAHYKGIKSHLHFEIRKGEKPVNPIEHLHPSRPRCKQ